MPKEKESRLDKMLKDRLGWEFPECRAEAEAIEQDLFAIKSVFKEWLRAIPTPRQMSEESTIQFLIVAVDKPEGDEKKCSV